MPEEAQIALVTLISQDWLVGLFASPCSVGKGPVKLPLSVGHYFSRSFISFSQKWLIGFFSNLTGH